MVCGLSAGYCDHIVHLFFSLFSYIVRLVSPFRSGVQIKSHSGPGAVNLVIPPTASGFWVMILLLVL